jgi:hypothetical protein
LVEVGHKLKEIKIVREFGILLLHQFLNLSGSREF